MGVNEGIARERESLIKQLEMLRFVPGPTRKSHFPATLLLLLLAAPTWL